MKLFIHSWRQITGNLDKFMQITWPLLAFGVLEAGLLATGVIGGSTADGASGGGMGLVFASIFISALVAIAWHRFVLRSESVGQAYAAAQSGKVWRYIGRSILIGLILVPVGMAVILVYALVIGPMIGLPFGTVSGETFVPGPGITPAMIIAMLLVIWLSLRLSVILPGIAMETPIKISESWAMTRRMNGQIVQFVALLAVLTGLGMYIEYMLQPAQTYSFAAGVIGAIVYWFTAMLGVSALTTLYGHLVEGRPLNA